MSATGGVVVPLWDVESSDLFLHFGFLVLAAKWGISGGSGGVFGMCN